MSLARIKRSLGILAAVAGIVTVVACSDNNNPTAPNPSPSVSPMPSPAAAADVTITIKGMLGDKSFDPNPATVKVGQTVSWHNTDVTTHSITGTGWQTGDIAPGATSAPIKFSTAGTFDYHCSIHPTMTGTLDVK